VPAGNHLHFFQRYQPFFYGFIQERQYFSQIFLGIHDFHHNWQISVPALLKRFARKAAYFIQTILHFFPGKIAGV
jgi:hypothetical protein